MTASSIPPDKLEAYRRGAREREERRRRAAAERREAGWRVAQRAARVLAEEYGATRVLVFGSLAHGAWFHAESDVDLAVEGVAPGQFWRAWIAADEVSDEFEINLVALEAVAGALRTQIQEQGVPL